MADDHRPRSELVICTVPVPSSLQDGSGTASAEEAQPGRGSNFQLLADIEFMTVSKVIEQLLVHRLKPHLLASPSQYTDALTSVAHI